MGYTYYRCPKFCRLRQHFPSHDQIHARTTKGPRFSTLKLLDIRTHFKPTQYSNIPTFQYTHLNAKKDVIKGEALRLIRTNSVKENFENSKRDFKQRVYKKSYLEVLVENILKCLPFVTTFNPAVPNLKKILLKRCPC